MKTNILKTGLCLFLFLSFMACSKEMNNSKHDAESISLEATGETSSFAAYSPDDSASTDKKIGQLENYPVQIIRNADCRMKVLQVSNAMTAIKSMVQNYQGYVADERYTHTNYRKENRFTIRIPQKHFDQVLDSICSLAEFVDHKNITTVDVSEEYVDISSRLRTKLEVKNRYETILRSKSKTVEDLLRTEEKLKDIQEEIEAAQGRLSYLSNKVAFSTIQLDVYETVIPKKEPAQYEPVFLDKAKQGFSFGWSLIQSVVLMCFYIWPFWVVGLVVAGYFKWRAQRKRSKGNQ